jgi:hypothetical protein
MSRFKITLGLIVLAIAATLVAIALRPSHTERKTIEQRQLAEPVAVQRKMPAARSPRNDAILQNFASPPGESNRADTSAPRMQTKQIKMH